MEKEINRRRFLKKSALASTGAALGLALEEKILLGQTMAKANAAERQTSGKELPAGKIGNVNQPDNLRRQPYQRFRTRKGPDLRLFAAAALFHRRENHRDMAEVRGKRNQHDGLDR
jgi:hypothetical protein